MRLIDADKLIMDLKNYALLNAPRRGEGVEVYDAIANCIKAVEEQPTAYDIDKYIKKLENLEKVLDRTIKIVKRGEKEKEGKR